MRRMLGFAILAVGALLAAWILWPQKPLSDEDAIRAGISKMAKAAGDRDVSGIAEHVSERYRGEGGTDKAELKQYLLGWMMRSQHVEAVPAKVQVQVTGDTAHVSMVVVLARGTVAAATDGAGEVGTQQIEANFAREGRAWRVVGATRREAGVEDLVP